MREIKFRGKRLDNGEWAYGYLWIIPGVNLHYILTGKINVRDCSIEKYEVDPETVGQYTGLKDRNGKEIYEGDVLKSIMRINDEWKATLQVSFLNGCFMFGNWNAHEYFNKHTEIEVIGNIYFNPDLLAVNER